MVFSGEGYFPREDFLRSYFSQREGGEFSRGYFPGVFSTGGVFPTGEFSGGVFSAGGIFSRGCFRGSYFLWRYFLGELG